MKRQADKVTPSSAEMNYDAAINAKAIEYAPLVLEAFETKTALLVAVDNATRFLKTAYESLGDCVTADYFCKHSPLSEYPEQLLTLMLLFVECGVFYPTSSTASVFSLDNAHLWKFKAPANPG